MIIILLLTAVGGVIAHALLPAVGRSNCDLVQGGSHWMTEHVETRDQLRQEISELLVDNRCDGITPEKLRKILLDMEMRL